MNFLNQLLRDFFYSSPCERDRGAVGWTVWSGEEECSDGFLGKCARNDRCYRAERNSEC
jgi:hypothetical protein